MPYSWIGGTRALLLSALLLVAGIPVFAGGQGEDRLDEADRLISQKQYDEAIRLLVEIRDEDPEKADPVQERLDLVLSLRNAISDTEERAIAALEREDLESFVRIMNEIDQLDPNPNLAKSDLYKTLRREAQVIVNRDQVDEVMEVAAGHLRNGRLSEAMQTYAGALDIGLNMFRDSGYGETAVQQVEALRNGFADAATTFVTLRDRVDRQDAAKNAALSLAVDTAAGLDQLAATMDTIVDSLYELSLTRTEIVSIDQSIQTLKAGLSAPEDGLGEAHYLSYLDMYINGRDGRADEEGALSIVESYWSERASPLDSEVQSVVDAQFARGVDRYYGGDRAGATSYFNAAARAAALYSNALSLWSSQIRIGDGLELSGDGRRLLESLVPKYVYASSRSDLGRVHEELAPSLALAEDLGSVTSDMRLPDLAELRLEASEVGKEMLEMASVVEAVGVEYDRYEAADIDTGDVIPLLDRLAGLLSSGYEQSRDVEIRTVQRSAELRLADVESNFEPEVARVEAGRELVEGVEERIGEGDTQQVLVNRYPEQGKSQLILAREGLEAVLRQSRTVLEDYSDEERFVLSDPAVASVLADGRRTENDIDALLSETNRLIAAADELVANAERYQQQTLALLDTAGTYVENRQFAMAKNSIAQAQQTVVDAATYKKDEQFEEEVNSRIASLTERISSAQTGEIITEVRSLINSARLSYGRAEYALANSQIVSAQSRWLEAFAETDPEIEYWLTIIQNALEVQTGRDVEVTHPQYTEIQQRLNVAYKHFEDAKKALEEGRRVDALRKLDAADQELSTVRVQFPYNQQASLLSWRIMEVRDPDRYGAEVESLIREANTKLQEDPRVAYNELQDLLEIVEDSARRSRIQELIVDAEFALGLRQPPPNPVRVEESNELYNRAFAIYEERDRSNYETAIAYLNAALEANPNNAQAQQLKDQLTVSLGGNAQFSLSVGDLRLYNEAASLVAAGDYAGAYLITRGLMQKNDTNRNYRPLSELHRRIEARLFGSDASAGNPHTAAGTVAS